MTRKIKIHIPLSFNALPHQNNIIITRYGAKKNDKLKHYQYHLALMAKQEAMNAGWEMLEKYFKAEICFIFKNKKHGDMDNCEKTLFDALEGVIYKNDKYCKDKHVWYDYGDEASITIEITEMVL